jgi:hypothetical protein
LEARCRAGGVVQQRGFADARLATHNQGATVPGPNVGEQFTKRLDLLYAAS